MEGQHSITLPHETNLSPDAFLPPRIGAPRLQGRVEPAGAPVWLADSPAWIGDRFKVIQGTKTKHACHNWSCVPCFVKYLTLLEAVATAHNFRRVGKPRRLKGPVIWCLVVPALALNPSSRRELKRACDGRVSEQRACKRRGAPSLHHGAWTAVAATLFSFLTTTSIVYSDFFKSV